MAVPDFQTCMRPVLETLTDGQERRAASITETVADVLKVSPEDRATRLKTGETILANRVGWATTYLVKANAVERPRRGFIRITKRGRDLLADKNPIRIAALNQFPEFVTFRTATTAKATDKGESATPEPAAAAAVSPQEAIEIALARANQLIQDDLRRRLGEAEPSFFERVVLDLLEAMGYAGAKGSAQALGGTGDGGVDGVIHQDALGLDSVYIQAKRYAGSVGAPEVNNFLGALDRKKASKGVLLTTGTFSRPAVEAARETSKKVVLIDGDRLSQLMVEHGVGVSTLETYKLQRVDGDYFETD